MAREMKDSGYYWIGEIPIIWQIRKVKDLYQIQTGFTPDTKREEYYADEIEGYDWLTIGDLDGKRYIPQATKSHISKLYVQKFNPSVIPKGSLLYSFKLSVGQVAITDRDIYSNEAIASFMPNDGVCLEFLYYSSSMIVENANENIYGAKILNQELINNARVVCPPIDEQKKIALFLDRKCKKLDAVLEKNRASIEEYKKLKQAIITQAVTKGVRGNREEKDSQSTWFGQIPSDIKISRVGLHYEIILGKMLCTNQIDDTYTYEPYFCAADIHFEGIAESERKRMWFSPLEKQQYLVREDDLLVVEGGAGAGGCTVASKQEVPTYIQNSVMIVRSGKSADVRYLKYLIECLVKQGYIDVACNKATIPHFTKDKLANVPFLVFSVQEQKEIAQYLDKKCSDIDAIISYKENYIMEIENYKKSLIYEYVTGKKEVPPEYKA